MFYKKKIALIYISFLLILLGCDNKQNSISSIQSETIENNDQILFNGIIYGIIEYNGKKWFDRNLGAQEPCSNYKGNKSCWGDLYQWGRASDGHQHRESGTSLKQLGTCMESDDRFVLIDAPGDILKEVDKIAASKWYKRCDNKSWYQEALNSLCPVGWHVPSVQDIKSLDLKNIRDGFRKIKLSLAGSRTGIERYGMGGNIIGGGTSGTYWLSSYDKNDKGEIVVGYLDFYTQNVDISFKESLVDGYSIRCVKDD